jgi:polysaccharide export outer membrane protein
MYYNKTTLSAFFLLCVLLLSSCAEVKNIAYFQKYDSTSVSINDQRNAFELNRTHKKPNDLTSFADSNSRIYRSATFSPEKNSAGLYEAHIKPKDLLSITVVSSEPDASRIYNLVVPQIEDVSSPNNLFSQPTLQSYMVSNEGNINFPVLGKIKVAGLTRKELEAMLLEKIGPAFSREKPIITIRFVNYTVNILGEVQKPGKYETTNDRLTIFEGLALAGDLTIYGLRDNVKVLRESTDGSKEYITLNLNDKNIIYSPAFYLEQNDVVYVEPNKSRSKSSNYGAAESFGITSLSVLLTLTSLVFTVFNLKL